MLCLCNKQAVSKFLKLIEFLNYRIIKHLLCIRIDPGNFFYFILNDSAIYAVSNFNVLLLITGILEAFISTFHVTKLSIVNLFNKKTKKPFRIQIPSKVIPANFMPLRLEMIS